MQQVDLESLSPDDLLCNTTLCHQKKSLWQLAEMEHLAELDRRKLYESQGLSSTAEWAATTFGTGYMRSAELVDVSVALAGLPRLKEALLKPRAARWPVPSRS